MKLHSMALLTAVELSKPNVCYFLFISIINAAESLHKHSHPITIIYDANNACTCEMCGTFGRLSVTVAPGLDDKICT